MKEINLTLPLEPVPKGRPRFNKTRYGIIPYTPPKTKRFEQDVALLYIQSNSPQIQRNVPIEVSIEFGMVIPASSSKKKKEQMLQGLIHHTVKPDLDNLTKAVLDALNNLAWHDDSQIVTLYVTKKYGASPYIHIIIKEVL